MATRTAAICDASTRVPAGQLDESREAGALIAVPPKRPGGLGLGTEPGGAEILFALLCRLGQSNLSARRCIPRTAFVDGNPLEPSMRDPAIYLRQDAAMVHPSPVSESSAA